MTPDNPSRQQEFAADMRKQADALVEHLKSRFGDHFDYSVKSLESLEAALDEAYDYYSEMPEEQRNGLISGAGSYIFEVARTNFGGNYFWYDRLNQPILVTGLPDFEISILAYEKVKGRLENGAEDHIPFYFRGYSERVKDAVKGYKALIT